MCFSRPLHCIDHVACQGASTLQVPQCERTDGIVAAVKQFRQRTGGTLLFYDVGTFLLQSQFTEDASGYALDTLQRRVQQLQPQQQNHTLASTDKYQI